MQIAEVNITYWCSWDVVDGALSKIRDYIKPYCKELILASTMFNHSHIRPNLSLSTTWSKIRMGFCAYITSTVQ